MKFDYRSMVSKEQETKQLFQTNVTTELLTIQIPITTNILTNTQTIELTSIPSTPSQSIELTSIPSSFSQSKDIMDSFVSSTVLLIVTANRPDYLRETLSYVIKYHPRRGLPILISEDGDHPQIHEVVEEAKRMMRDIAPQVEITHVHHPPSLSSLPADNGYIKLCRHFKFALDEVFYGTSLSSLPPAPRLGPESLSPSSSPLHFRSRSRVVVLEEDLRIAPDFFDLFAALSPMIDSDPSLLAASAWNDNGLSSLSRDPTALYRSDFFPGLGWMASRSVISELLPKWPRGYWDDWLREPAQRKGRAILRPEVCRSFHFGMRGVSNAQYSEFLTEIRLNESPVPFPSLDLSYLHNEEWENVYVNRIRSLPLSPPSIPLPPLAPLPLLPPSSTPYVPEKEIRIQYSSLEGGQYSFPQLAHKVGCMDNIKAGVPRTAYKGIVSVWRGDTLVHLTPAEL